MIGRRREVLHLGNEDLQTNAGGGKEDGSDKSSARLPTAVMTAPEHGMVAVGFDSGEVRMKIALVQCKR